MPCSATNVMVKNLDEMHKLGHENAEALTMSVDVFSKRAGDGIAIL
jgi:hypothetical protein